MSIYAAPAADALRHSVDTVIFDMDGVLIDISRSIRRVNVLAPAFYMREVLQWSADDNMLTSEIVEAYKHAGGFNDDWDLTYAIVLAYIAAGMLQGTKICCDAMSTSDHFALADAIALRGGGLAAAEAVLLNGQQKDDALLCQYYNKPVIRQVFEEMFAGDLCERIYHHDCRYYLGPGLVYEDRCLLDPDKLPAGRRIGMQTGRTYEEAAVGREMCKLEKVLPDEVCITKADGFHKPEPGGLEMLARRLGTRSGAVYIGDTLDDLRTVRNLNALGSAPPFLAALVLTGPEGAKNEAIFRANKPDIIAEDVNEVLEWLVKNA